MSSSLIGTASRRVFRTTLTIAVALSTLVGWLDFHASEVQPAVLLLMLITAGLAYVEPSRAWLWALIMGLSVQTTHVIASSLGITQRYPMTPAYGGLVALIPAAIGAACGFAGRTVFSRRQPH
jgi:hypothetical protein